MRPIIAVDIGGTHVRAALYSEATDTPMSRAEIATHSQDADLFSRLCDLIEQVRVERALESIGVAAPGPLDPRSGTILRAPNIQEWIEFPLGSRLTERFGVSTYVDNDANLAALAEWRLGAGRGHSDVLYLTVGTGVGGGLILNGQLIHGSHGLAAEFGHMLIDPAGPQCSCGKHGHLESYASGTAIAAHVRRLLEEGATSSLQDMQEITSSAVAEAAQEGDELSRRALERAGHYLGIAISNCCMSFDPSVVILGGGVLGSGEILLQSIRRSVVAHVLHPRYLEGLEITRGTLGDDAGLLGALLLARAGGHDM